MRHTSQGPTIKTQVDQFGRKKFTVLESREQDEEEVEVNDNLIDIGRNKSTLIGRDESLNIDKYIGRIETKKKKRITEVFFCNVCEEGFKCDMAYITHMNSPAHNRKLGMNMKVKAVSVETVSEKIKKLSQKKSEGKEAEIEQVIQKYEGEEKLEQIGPIEQQAQQNSAGQDSQAKDDQNHQQSEDETEKLMKQMGLPTSFGSKKVKRY